ncbi:hypothetical protein BCEN4_740012 [Burkholderia cenocepacia]|nr:hypothetical protein BCEN4_740012 [Burkholderia cenocepacia]
MGLLSFLNKEGFLLLAMSLFRVLASAEGAKTGFVYLL